MIDESVLRTREQLQTPALTFYLAARYSRREELAGYSCTGNERCDQHPWHRTNSYHENWYGPAIGATP